MLFLKKRVRLFAWAFALLAAALAIFYALFEKPVVSEINEAAGEVSELSRSELSAPEVWRRMRQSGSNPVVKGGVAEHENEGAETGLRAILEIANRDERRAAMHRWGEELAARNPEEARKIIEEWIARPGTLRAEVVPFLEPLVLKLAAVDPKHAVGWSEFLPDELKEVAYGLIAGEWMKREPEGAVEWSSTIGDDRLRSAATGSVWPLLDRPGFEDLGVRWAQRMARNGTDSVRHADVIGRVWARVSEAEPLQWAMQIPDPSAKALAFGSIAQAIAVRDPELARTLVLEFPEEGGVRDHAINMVSYSMRNVNPEAAHAWANWARGRANEVSE
jgi:hypothetical protein